MADNAKYIQAQRFSLAVGISTTDTSITVQSFNFPDGSAITSSDLGLSNFATLEPGTEREEQISFTGFTTNADGTVTITGVTRGLGFGAGDTYSEQADLKVQHGTGATLVLSNTAGFYDTFVNKNNDETITGTLTVPTPTAAAHAATKSYVDSAALGGATVDQVIVAGTAGESVAAGDLVYFDDTDDEWKKTDADTTATIDNVLLGVAQGSGSDGVAITGGVLTYGVDTNQSGLTVGVKLYVSNTAGEIAESAGTNEKVIGWSKSATEVYFDPYHGALPSGGEKAALAAGGDFGTPSSSNKYLTEDYLTNKNVEVVSFTSSGTWTKDSGLKYITVEIVGGGGQGGAGFTAGESGGGGGGGGYSRKTIQASELGSTEVVTVGAGSTGSGGGTTSFGSHCSATGGSDGEDYDGGADGGAGGVGSGGDINSNGQGGGAGADANTETNGGFGGSSFFGGGARGVNLEVGVAGSAYGGGGSGSHDSSSSGGNGADGFVVVTEYYS